ncbi:MAG TPA: YkgJ family cysteine cluster protein [Polyangiales bacterium]|nr:YkgJ family cysteine cluster protein [Polyangiales bacterium]
MKTPSNGKVARGKVARGNGRSNGHGVSGVSGKTLALRAAGAARSGVKPPPKLQLPILNANLKPSERFGCAQCGLCCTYVAIEVDGPTTVKRATELLWYLYHQGVSLYLNDDDWMVQFETTCRYLTADRRCGVYATRPHICREFSEKECEVNTGDDGQTFYDATAFVAYLKQARPRVYALVMKDFAPPVDEKPEVHPFQSRLSDVYARRTAALAAPPNNAGPSARPRAATRTSLPLKKSRGSSASTDTL